jgi:hypothetical protein
MPCMRWNELKAHTHMCTDIDPAVDAARTASRLSRTSCIQTCLALSCLVFTGECLLCYPPLYLHPRITRIIHSLEYTTLTFGYQYCVSPSAPHNNTNHVNASCMTCSVSQITHAHTHTPCWESKRKARTLMCDIHTQPK